MVKVDVVLRNRGPLDFALELLLAAMQSECSNPRMTPEKLKDLLRQSGWKEYADEESTRLGYSHFFLVGKKIVISATFHEGTPDFCSIVVENHDNPDFVSSGIAA